MEYTNIFDSHSHYFAKEFDDDRDELLSLLPSRGVRRIMSVADTIQSSYKCVDMANKFDYIYASAGIHPHNAKNAPANFEADIAAMVAANPKVKAIGEAGLDYHYDFSPRDQQLAVFERQLVLAQELDMPIIIHDREAHQDTLDLLKKYRPKGIVHCYSGSAEMALEIVALGLYIGFTGAVTFANAKRAVKAAAAIPAEKLLVETDCPYMAPTPLRGNRSDSSMIVYTAGVLAGIKGMDTQQLLDITYQNACTVYNI